jgi:hypothetical protein
MRFTKILLVCFALMLFAGLGTNHAAGAAVGSGNPQLNTLMAGGPQPPPIPPLMADGPQPPPIPPLANSFVV